MKMKLALISALAVTIFVVQEPASAQADPLKYERVQSRGRDNAKEKDRGSAIFKSLGKLQKNPRYRGKVLGTVIRPSARNSNKFVYEVRILRPDDRVVLVYIDPRSGRVIGDVLR